MTEAPVAQELSLDVMELLDDEVLVLEMRCT